jgi:hypothetical protein
VPQANRYILHGSPPARSAANAGSTSAVIGTDRAGTLSISATAARRGLVTQTEEVRYERPLVN